MSEKILIKQVRLVNEGQVITRDVLINNGLFEHIGNIDSVHEAKVIDGTGYILFPGIIDGQVHFRDPGLTHKGDLYSESKAAIAGGVTSFIDMPNTVPNVLTQELLNEKYRLASEKSLANFGFFMGVNESNMEEVLRMNTAPLLAVSDDGLYFTKKGNLLADNPALLEKLFKDCKAIIAIHAEKEQIIEANEAQYRKQYGEEVPPSAHPLIRSADACYNASADAIALAEKHGARLHILHLTSEAETHLFRNDIPLREKRITTEVTVQHLWFSDKDYAHLGNRLKWNPAVKTEADRSGLFKALLDDRIDIITTDHAPHTVAEKDRPYFQSMSGGPMVQHSLNIMLEFYRRGDISLEKIVEKMCHNPAILYHIDRRGFIREGYHADAVLINLNAPWVVSKNNILSRCGWSPLEGTTFHARVEHTVVNGHHVYENGVFHEEHRGQALTKQ
ncbi:MAG: dihydroorotase [Chitinophagaceae bacterium]|nr:dihydroorotase [Chitinophagaceae bacterium]